jgi:carbon-monoxide dehydrogenase large subunit
VSERDDPRLLGRPVLRVEDRRLITGAGRYAADHGLEGAACVTFVSSLMAHARLRRVEVERARAADGVIAVFTAADLDLAPLPPWLSILEQRMVRSWLAADVVRFVGEPVVALVAEDHARALDAADLVRIDYEPLPPVIDPEIAARDEQLLFPTVGTNTCIAIPDDPAAADLFAGCDVVVKFKLRQQRMAACPIEPRAAVAAWNGERLTYYASTQEPHSLRARIARVLGLAPDQVRVVIEEVGGAFGAKGGDYPEEILVAWIARRLGRPIAWIETRSQSMVGMFHGRALVQHVELGGRRDGTLLGYRIRVIQDSGAYPQFAAALIHRARVLASGVYAIPRVESSGRAVVTNTTPVGAVRGAGRPEANIAIERALDRFAAEIGVDPAEVRRRNLIASDRFPYTTPTGSVYDSGDYRALLDRVLSAGRYNELRAEQAGRRASGDPTLLGVGLGMFVEISDTDAAGEFGAVEITLDGRAIVRTGSAPHGQGHQTVWSQIVADRLGLPLDRIEVRYGDTDEIPAGVGTYASRSAQAGGSAVYHAANEVLAQARRLAADLLEADPADIALDRATGRLSVVGSPAAGLTWAALAQTALKRGTRLGHERAAVADQTPAWPSGAVLAAVEVDSETGVTRLRSLVTCDDAGRLLNPLIAAGQVHGGLAFGVAHGLLEEFVYDADGNPLTLTFGDYGVITVDRVPRYQLDHIVTPAPGNPLGVKGLGESGSVGAPAAILNAVVDALASFGIRHLDLPCTPERVLRAIATARGEAF